ncbi:MAG: hypothetical protein F9K29_14185, partial [Hyphomicrobiaceae bacterium]
MQHIDHIRNVPSEPMEGVDTAVAAAKSCAGSGEKVRAMLKARLGEDIFSSWFAAMEFESFDGRVVRATVPVKFLKSWIQSHYADDLLECCAAEFAGAERVELALRQPGMAANRPAAAAATQAQRPRAVSG